MGDAGIARSVSDRHVPRSTRNRALAEAVEARQPGADPAATAAVDRATGPAHDLPMDDETVDPREAARNRRRDRDAEAEAKALLRPGMGKVFKQIQDAQRRAATSDEAEPIAARRTARRPRRPKR
jgi:hypothetical protein